MLERELKIGLPWDKQPASAADRGQYRQATGAVAEAALGHVINVTSFSEVKDLAEKEKSKPAQVVNSKIGTDAERIRASAMFAAILRPSYYIPVMASGGGGN